MAGHQLIDLHLILVGRGVNELAVADVDAHMRGGVRGIVTEEYQIAGLQLTLGYRHTVGQLGRSGAVQSVAEVAIYVAGEAGAVKTIGSVAAIDIGHTQELLGVADDLLESLQVTIYSLLT